jgi:hypothetical protein
MHERRLLMTAMLAVLAGGAIPAPAPAARPAAVAEARGVDDPRAFVARMYDAYVHAGEDQPPPDPAYAYSPRLAALFAAYQRWQGAHPDTVGALDFDWWTNAQDWRISQVSVIARADDGPGRQTVTARFRNVDRAESIRFEFLLIGGRWFLDDAVAGSGRGDDGWTLSALLRQRE